MKLGLAKHGEPIGLDEKPKVGMIVIGSVVVDPKTGAWLGKGKVRISTRLFLPLSRMKIVGGTGLLLGIRTIIVMVGHIIQLQLK